jgi:hypothetical protein
MRSLSRQNRNAELRHGVPAPAPPGEDLYSDPDSDPGAAPASGPQKPPPTDQPPTEQPTTGQPGKD